ncbi:UNVERIFIED_CONTAM: hypothetical protein Slati_2447600 [Sesamum latifolium]|uniref:Aminotransferase-like plant mobile domain-containing protein n=1 Tax=Sesamum latifolium TaxID=2727402 RepID=A0AAW2WI51_9LAMI
MTRSNLRRGEQAYTPLIGRYARQWPRLTNPLYTEQWSREAAALLKGKPSGETLFNLPASSATSRIWEWTEDILSRCEQKLVAAQVYDSVYASLFTYDRNSEVIKAFCEAWCPSTNTLLTSFGELSISLWDLHTLAGLPINGLLYDEVVHVLRSLTVLTRRDEEPRSTVNLPAQREKSGSSQLTHNPSGTFGVHGKWSSAEESLFSKLGIEGSLKEETFLAAYLACWLCTFALPTDGVGLIRPSTFKVASIMAAGRRIGLVVPVLASIYKDSLPSFARCTWAQDDAFLGEGGAKYYDPQEARKRIHKGDFVSWTCNMIAKDKDFSFVDDGRAKDFEEAYFMAIRSNYLPLRQGDHFDVEPYSPHRFGHQFGFFQEVPGILSQDIHRASLEDGILLLAFMHFI